MKFITNHGVLAGLLLLSLAGCSDEQPTTTEPVQEIKSVEVSASKTKQAEPWDSARLTATLNALPAGDIQRGEAAHNSLMCVACHAVTGVPSSRNFVNLNHQPENYLKKVLIDYRDDRRAEPYGQSKIMTYIAKTLSDQQIADLAAFYASQALPKGKQAPYQPDPVIESLVGQGDMSRMVMSCAACHGSQGQGNGDLFPALAGQEVDYTIRTLTAYRNGDRKNDINSMMGNIAKNLTDAEIVGLANYYANLNP